MLGAPGGRSSPVPSTEGTLGRLSACMTVLELGGGASYPVPLHIWEADFTKGSWT